MFSHGWSERTVVRKDWRFVWGITSNVHRIGPLPGAGALGSPEFTSNVTVPLHVPARNDAWPEGAAGFGDARPHATRTTSIGTGTHQPASRVMSSLLPSRSDVDPHRAQAESVRRVVVAGNGHDI